MEYYLAMKSRWYKQQHRGFSEAVYWVKEASHKDFMLDNSVYMKFESSQDEFMMVSVRNMIISKREGRCYWPGRGTYKLQLSVVK